MRFGCLTGSIMGGWQCGHFGRRLSMIIDCFGCFSGLLLLTLSPNFYLALLARFILGHAGASGIVSVPIYVGEISQPQLRDLTSSFTVVCFACGSSIILIIGAAFPWRIAVGISSLVPLVSILILIFCPESPVWLMTKERENEAKNSLEKLRGPDNVDIVEAEFNRIKMNIKVEAKEDEVTEKKNILNTLFDPSFLKPFSLLLLVFCINLEWCGVAAVAFYMVPVLE